MRLLFEFVKIFIFDIFDLQHSLFNSRFYLFIHLLIYIAIQIFVIIVFFDTITRFFTVNEYESKTAFDVFVVVMFFDFEHVQTIDLTIEKIMQISSNQSFSFNYTIMFSSSSQLYSQMMQYDEKFIDFTNHDDHNQVNANHHRTQTKNQH